MRYQVRVVEDGQLPVRTPWVFVRSGPDQFMFIKRTCFRDPTALCRALSTAWAVWETTALLPIAS